MLELGEIGRAQGISLCNNWYQVDTSAKSLHHLNIQRLQGMASWADEIQTSVYTQVNLLLADWLLFLEHIGFVLIVKELDNWLPGITIVHVITEARSINDSKTDCNLHQLIAKYTNCS